MVRAALISLIATVAAAASSCGAPRAAPSGAPGAAPRAAPGAAIDDAQLAALLRDAGRGAALITDVATGARVASAAIGRDLDAPVLPLSILKLYLAALWWEHDLGAGDFIERGRRVTVHDVLVDGWDRPGEAMAIALRDRLGAAAMLAELRLDGLDGLGLPDDADDARWGSALSIGEHDARVTLAAVARFLGAIGGGGEGAGSPSLRPDTCRRLQAAMRDAVARGTAKSAGARLAGLAWQLGGKTGTGPADTDPHDGWFAGLIFEAGAPRFAIAVYIERRGPGGGVAAGLAADVTRRMAGAPVQVQSP